MVSRSHPVDASDSRPLIITEENTKNGSIFIFNSELLKSYFSDFTNCKLSVIAIAGSQSTGKSTLLNKAFGLKLPIMNSFNSGQTTRNIEMEISRGHRWILLDTENNGEDQSYIERMVASFGVEASNQLLYRSLFTNTMEASNPLLVRPLFTNTMDLAIALMKINCTQKDTTPPWILPLKKRERRLLRIRLLGFHRQPSRENQKKLKHLLKFRY